MDFKLEVKEDHEFSIPQLVFELVSGERRAEVHHINLVRTIKTENELFEIAAREIGRMMRGAISVPFV